MKLFALTIIALSALSTTQAWETRNGTSYSGGCYGCISGKTQLSDTSAVAMKEEKKNRNIEEITKALAGEEVELSTEISDAVISHMSDGASYEEALLEVLKEIVSE